MAVKIFTTQRLAQELSEDLMRQLVKEFRQYKETGTPTQNFGRDFPYDRPYSAKSVNLQHVHVHPNFLIGKEVNALTNTLRTWRLRSVQVSRTSDTHLIYCQGEHNPNAYLLISFVKSNAHEFANITSAIGALADIAADFQRKH